MSTKDQKYPNQLKKAIKQSGYTLGEIAAETHIPVRTLTDYCAGRVPIPKNRLEVLARVLGYPSESLVSILGLKEESTKEGLEGKEGSKTELWSEPIAPYPSLKGESETVITNTLILPVSITQQNISGEIPLLPDCTAWLSLKLAELVTLVHQWYGMAMFCNELQDRLDGEIKKLDARKSHYPPNEYILSRRGFLTTLAALPTALLTMVSQKHKVVLVVEELLPQCAASLIACWHLSEGSHLEVIAPILDSYLPTLIQITLHVPSYRKVAAVLVAQIYTLKAILAWHLEGLDRAETYCAQALSYSHIAENTNLQVTALNQYALISYYAKNYEQALLKSEEADKTVRNASQEHIFPIIQGRVAMYLSAIQAQQNRKIAEYTLERAQKAFALQADLAEPVPTYADCGKASLMLWDGLTHYYLGQNNTTHAKRALVSLQRFGQISPDATIPERFRLECLNNRTRAAVQLHELEEAMMCIKAGRQGAKNLESKQRGKEVDDGYLSICEHWPAEAQIHASGNLDD